MNFKPILFSTAMVQAILDGIKTQTRRVLKTRNSVIDGYPWSLHQCGFDTMDWNDVVIDGGGFAPESYLKVSCTKYGTRNRIYPKVEIGDVFWVRETWAEAGNFASNEFSNSEVIAYRTEDAVFYDTGKPLDTFAWNWDKIKWKPSIFMPKEACRIFLEVTNVRVERLQDISEEDSLDEGVIRIRAHNDETLVLGYPDYTIALEDGFDTFFNPKESFLSLWESINGKESLNSNPWVWVYDFKVIDKPENFI